MLREVLSPRSMPFCAPTPLKAVQSFVDGYNAANATLNKLTAFNGVGAQNGILLGDSTSRNIQVQMRSMLTAPVNSGNALTTLSQIGISFQSDGTLALDSAKLGTAINTNFDSLGALFNATGKATDSLVAYSGSTSKTVPGTYAVDVTRLATRGATQGSQAAALTVTAGTNDQLTLNVDGTVVNVTLAAGTYASADALAAEIQSKINGATGTSGSVVVSQTSGVLSITSARYGSASQATVTGGNGMASLLGAAPSFSLGFDVAGTINGVAATGNGQTMSGAIGNASEGLSLNIVGGTLGARGNVTFSQGYAYQLSQYLGDTLGTTGSLKARTDGINSSIKGLTQRQQELQTRLAETEKRYRAQFTALDTMISGMNSTSSFLTQQLANLPKA